MAYADGALDAATQEAVKQQIDQDPESQALLRIYLETGQSLSEAFKPIYEAPLPAAWIDLVNNHGRAVSRQADATADAYISQRGKSLFTRMVDRARHLVSGNFDFTPQLAAASAMFIFAVGAGFGWLVSMNPTPTPGHPANTSIVMGALAQDSPMATALARTPSRKAAFWKTAAGTDAAFMPIMSFQTKDRRLCRQFIYRTTTRAGVSGLACKHATGGWRIEVAGNANIPILNKDNVKTASVVKHSRHVEKAIDGMISGDFFAAADEARHIANGWQVK